MATMSRKRRVYRTPEFQAEAVRQVKSTDRPLSHVARDLGLSPQLLWKWVQREKEEVEAAAEGELNPTEREELKQLRRRVARLEEEREILKKATAFFAKESK